MMLQDNLIFVRKTVKICLWLLVLKFVLVVVNLYLI